MRERVVITGVGCVSCFGVGAAAFGDAIAAGRGGIARVDRFDTSTCLAHQAALITGFDPAAFIPPLKLRRIDIVGRTALVSARFALEEAGLASGEAAGPPVGVALGTVTAGLDSTVEYLHGLAERGPSGAPAILFSNTVANASASLCAIEFGLHGPNVTFNQREVSSGAAIAYSMDAIRDGRAAAMLTGGAEQVEETFFKVLDRFRALSPMRAAGIEAARPYDRRRNGYTLGEGAFMLVLESATSAAARGARVHAELLGAATTASRTKMNQWPSDAAGLTRAMRQALDQAGVPPADVACVIGCANGSPVLDRLESEAIVAAFDSRPVPVLSIKGAIGESGAAMAAGVVSGISSLRAGSLPPTVGFDSPDSACDVNVSSGPAGLDGDVFVVNGVAGGGTNVSLVVRVVRP